MHPKPNGPILVTGGSGFLAQHAIVQLLGRGLATRTTVRSSHKAAALLEVLAGAGADTSQLKLVEADLLVPGGWTKAVQGASAVLHMATPMSGKQVTAAALSGTRQVLEASIEAGVPRVVVTSSGLAAAPTGKSSVAENDWTDPDRAGTPEYAAAKTRAERLAWELAERHGLGLTTILPGVMLGPALGPELPVWLGVIAAMLEGRMPAVPPVPLQIADVRDVARLHIDALFEPRAVGQRYLAAGETVSFRDIALILKSELGARKVSTREMPVWLLRLLAAVNPQVGQLAALREAPHMSAAKAARELSWLARPPRDSVLDAARSLPEWKRPASGGEDGPENAGGG